MSVIVLIIETRFIQLYFLNLPLMCFALFGFMLLSALLIDEILFYKLFAVTTLVAIMGGILLKPFAFVLQVEIADES
jgi:glucose-6-phosphate-specific signal transduction histidine kinase